jgi:hypothetical protein
VPIQHPAINISYWVFLSRRLDCIVAPVLSAHVLIYLPGRFAGVFIALGALRYGCYIPMLNFGCLIAILEALSKY